jgi:hypothetical protein
MVCDEFRLSYDECRDVLVVICRRPHSIMAHPDQEE